MNRRNLIFFIIWIILLSSSCNSDPESLPYTDRASETNIESGSRFSSEEIAESVRVNDSLGKVAEAERPIACSFEYEEDIDFNKYVTIKLINNTKKVVNSVKLNIDFSSFQNDISNENNLELNKRVTIKPGKSITIKYDTEYNINNIEVVKYSSNGKVEYNGLQSLVKENRRKLNQQFPPNN